MRQGALFVRLGNPLECAVVFERHAVIVATRFFDNFTGRIAGEGFVTNPAWAHESERAGFVNCDFVFHDRFAFRVCGRPK